MKKIVLVLGLSMSLGLSHHLQAAKKINPKYSSFLTKQFAVDTAQFATQAAATIGFLALGSWLIGHAAGKLEPMQYYLFPHTKNHAGDTKEFHKEVRKNIFLNSTPALVAFLLFQAKQQGTQKGGSCCENQACDELEA